MQIETKRYKGWRYLPWLIAMVAGLLMVTAVSAGFPGSSEPGRASQAPTNQTVEKPNAINARATGAKSETAPLPGPARPNIVLYDQYNNFGSDAIVSTERTDNPSFTAETADDFVVPAGPGWVIQSVDFHGFPGIPVAGPVVVRFYTNAGTVPGTAVYTSAPLTATGTDPNYTATLNSPPTLAPGTYWVSVQVTQSSNWYWGMRTAGTINLNQAAWREAGGYGTGCTNWGNRDTCTGTALGDQMFRLNGELGGPTPTGTPPTATRTPSSTSTPCPSGGYTTTTTQGTIVPGTVDIGNHCDDCYTSITLPFAYTLYDQSFTTAEVGSNGNIVFGTGSLGFSNSCLPATGVTYTIFPHWDDLYTQDAAGGQGIFSSVSGSAPNRIFNLEWRAQFCCSGGVPAVVFELRLYEGQTRFDIIYGSPMSGNGNSATSGVQKTASAGDFTQYSCDTGVLTPGTMVVYNLTAGGCPSPTVGTTSTNTVTQTRTATATRTVTMTATATSTTCPPVGGTTFSNTALITIPTSGPATPYPAQIVVSGGPASITDVNVTFNVITHTFPDDIDMLLVGPGGQDAIIWSDAGGSLDMTATVTLDDESGTLLPDSGQISNGLYRPTNWGTGDTFPAPAPAPSGGSALSVFDGTNANGTWSLYIVDDLSGDLGAVTGGWSLTFNSVNSCVTGTPTVAATPTCPAGGVNRAMIVYADNGGPPTTLIGQMQAEGITTVTLFDAEQSTPTLAQLQAAPLVVVFSNNQYANPVGLGNVLADYADAGGIVVALNFNWFGSPFGLAGRWMTGGYTPYNDNAPVNFSTSNATITNPSHPLMQGVTTLTAFFRHNVTLSSGAVSVASWQDGPSAVAYKTNNGATGVAINAYLGENPMDYSGQFGRTIANAGRWLAGGGCPTNTVVPATSTRTNTAGVATPTCPAGGGTPGPWATAAPYPLANVRYGFAQTSTHFYVFGGVAGGTRVNTVHRYDIGAGTWSAPLAPMPFASEGPTCALMASTGIVYCAEGDTGTGFASYNTSTNVWTTLPAVPGTANRYGAASGAAGGKVFIIGGEFPGTTNVQVYDVTSNTWSAGTSAPSPYILGGYQQVGNFVYVIGSYTSAPLGVSNQNQSSVLAAAKIAPPSAPQANSTVSMRLDMTTAPGVWTTGPVWTPARADFGLAYDPGTNKLYAMGGDSTGGSYFNSTNLVDELSVAAWPAGTWVASPPVLTSPNRQANQAGFYGAGSIWSVGGIDGATFTFLNQVLRRSNGGGGGCPTNTVVVPTSTRTATVAATSTPDPCLIQNYTVATGSATIVPGTTNTGSACDDCVTSITLPFSYQLYDQTFTAAGADSNGKLHFPTGASVFSNTCLPGAGMTYTIFPFWDDLRTDGTGCTGGCGIFTSVTGSAPNRIFNIEWRTTYFSGTGTANFEVRLYEGQTRFDIIHGTITSPAGGTGGVQRNSTTFTQIFCNTTPANTLYTFTLPACGTPTVGPSATRTNTAGVATPTCPAGGGTPGPWATAAPYPLANVRYGFAQTSTHFYVFGGVAGGTRVNTVHRYDIGAGTWSAPLAPMPFASEGPTCALMASTGIVYCAEGDTGTGFASYNTSTNVWTTLPAVPGTANRYGAASGAAGGKVFIIGGEFPGTTNVQVYDVTSNTWSAGTAAPSPYILGGYQQVGNFVYVIGSYTSAPLGAEASSVLSRDKAADLDAPQANSTVSMRLDMTTAPGVWTTGPVWTPARADFGLAYDPGTNKLYAMGGDSTGGSYFNSTNLVDELSVAAWPAGTWVASPPVLTSPNRQANQAGFYGAGSIWSVGGIDGATFTFLNQVLRRSNGGGGGCPTNTVVVPTVTRTSTVGATPTCVPGGGGTPGPWATSTAQPPSRYRAGAVSVGTSVYVFGGGDNAGAFLNTMYRWNAATETWTQLANMPTGKQNIQGAHWNGRIYVPGGFASGSVHITENAIYDIATNTWSTGAPLPTTQSGQTAAWNGRIYQIGGNPGPQTTVRYYDVVANTWTTVAPLPVANTYGRAITVGNFIYYVGGIAGTTSNAVYRYDPVANTWSTMAPLQTARTSTELMTDAAGTKIFAVGGGNSTFFTGVPLPVSVEIYDIASNTWTYGPPLVQKVAAPAGGYAGGKLMIMNGVDGTLYPIVTQVSVLGGGGGNCPTNTAVPATSTRTNTAVPATSTRTSTAIVPTLTVVPPSNTAVPATSTRTNTVVVPPSSTAVPPSSTAVPPTSTVRPTNTPVSCTIQFTDVPPGTFYDEVRCLACRDIIDGYACGGTNPETGQAEPCNAQNWAYFRPNNRVIRGQIAKMVSNSSADFSAPGPQRYADVPTSATFFAFINRLTNRGVMGGYPCGGINPQGGGAEPCNAQNQPYFRPYNYATRGQIAQITARGANITDPVPAGTQSFTDVPINSTFYLPVERLRARGVMTGFPCGGVNPQTGAPEPCDAQNRAYFRVNNNATRGQTAQIVSRTFFPGCVTPFR